MCVDGRDPVDRQAIRDARRRAMGVVGILRAEARDLQKIATTAKDKSLLDFMSEVEKTVYDMAVSLPDYG